MNCLDFRRAVLADPNLLSVDCRQHEAQCAECASHLKSVKRIDDELKASLDVTMPPDLIARLELNTRLTEESRQRGRLKGFAVAASVLFAVMLGVMSVGQRFAWQQQVGEDYQSLLAGVAEHMHEVPVTPVWGAVEANQSVRKVLANYDSRLQLSALPNLTFGKICPMGKYRGLHAGLQTAHGLVTFAYIKGEPVKEAQNLIYEGQNARVKPLKGGNLIIVSPNSEGLQEVDTQLDQAIYWDV